MTQGHTKTYRAAVVLHVERVARQRDCFGEAIHDFSEAIERIGKLCRVRPVAVSKAEVVGRDKVVAIGKPRKQRLIHSRGRWQSMNQKNRGGIFRPRLSIEDGESIDLYCAIKNVRAHRPFTSLFLCFDATAKPA